MKYKKGDKIILEITDAGTLTDRCYLSGNLAMKDLEKAIKNLNIDNIKISEKIKNQRAEITRLLAENKRLKAENGNSLWNIEQARAEGQSEAWELAQRICSPDGYSHAELRQIFNFQVGATEIFQNTYPEAAAKVSQWEKAKEEIKVGDIVISKPFRNVEICVTEIDDEGAIYGISANGGVYSRRNGKDWEKTGRHIDVDAMLSQIGGEGDEAED